MIRRLAAVSALVAPALAPAADAALEEAMARRVMEHRAAAGLRIQVDLTSRDVSLPPCAAPPEVDALNRPRPFGRVTFVVRCESPAWSRGVAARVQAIGPVVRAARPLASGTLIAIEDLLVVDGDLGAESQGVATDPARVVGRQVAHAIAEGGTVPLNALRAPTVIRAGDRVSVVVLGTAFAISVDAVAEQAGGVGDSVRVRLPSGRSAVARVREGGVVELRM